MARVLRKGGALASLVRLGCTTGGFAPAHRLAPAAGASTVAAEAAGASHVSSQELMDMEESYGAHRVSNPPEDWGKGGGCSLRPCTAWHSPYALPCYEPPML